MPKDKWLEELEGIIEDGEEKVQGVIKAREKRENERKKRLAGIRDIITSKLDAVRDLMVGRKKGEEAAYPKISQTETEVVFEMSKLSEVNAADLLFRIELSDDGLFLRAFRRYARNTEHVGFEDEEDTFEDFVKDHIKRFLQSWYSRRLSDELDKEREPTIAVQMRGLKM